MIKWPIKNKSPMKTMLNIRKAKQVLQREPPASSPRLIRSRELCRQSPAMNSTNRLGIKSPHDISHRLSPFPIRNVNATANRKTEAYCKSFLFEFIAVIFKVLFTKILNLIKYPLSNPYKKSVSLHILLAFICHYKSK